MVSNKNERIKKKRAFSRRLPCALVICSMPKSSPRPKFVSVLKGKVYDVAIDLRKNSKTFCKVFSCILSEKKSQSIYIPPGFAHGFCGLDKENYIIYSCTNYRNASSERSIKYNDKTLNIKWPTNKPVVSKKDQNALTLNEFKKKYLK